MGSRTPLRSLPGSLTAAHEGSKLIPDPPSRSCAPVAHTAHQRSLSLSPHFERRRSAGVSVTRRIAGPGAFRGYPHGLTLRVQRGRVRLQWRPATALSYGSLHSTCTAIPPGPRPPSLVAGVYHTSSPRASVSLGVPPHLSKAAPRLLHRGLWTTGRASGVSRPSATGMPAHQKRLSALGGSGDRCQGHDSRDSQPAAVASWGYVCPRHPRGPRALPCSAFDGSRATPGWAIGGRPSSPP